MLSTSAGPIPVVGSSLTIEDKVGAVKARWKIGRSNFRVDPGLYAVGRPDETSPVLVTANYKMSFDELRKNLELVSAWILALDTDGVNVWCAAGKGSFGTSELVQRIQSSGLVRIVSHRNLILPQLGAPGIESHRLKKLCGFKARYGPIRAADLEQFLESNGKATPAMRLQTFTLRERLTVTPVELMGAIPHAAIVIGAYFLIGLLGGSGSLIQNAGIDGAYAAFALGSAFLTGIVIAPILLPWLPSRSFAIKGLFLGIALSMILALVRSPVLEAHGIVETFGISLSVIAICMYYTMNFTGCTTYTSLSGVKKEMKFALPFEIGAFALGAALWIVSRFI